MLGPLRKRLPVWPLVIGCLLPDLIDKPLYYLTPHTDLISGSRTFGHTLLFLAALIAAAAISRSRVVWALAAGVATHLLLDSAGEPFARHDPESVIWRAIFWPFYGHGRFPEARWNSLGEHLRTGLSTAYNLFGEAVGGLILLAAWRRRRQSS
ncbi:MAG TPA: metal-dependent hydrolase [Myxococcales bacterium]|nr:metal-dependent hydrolase [Myxococcales bacterium]